MRLTLLLILIVPVAFAQPPLWQQYLSDAFRLEKGNRFKEAKAVDLLDLKEEETPVDGGFRRAVTLNNLSLVNRNLGLHSEARELETRIAKLASTTPGKLLGLAVDVEGPLSTDPGSDLPSGSSWKALSAKGNRLREQGRCREAVPLLLRARSGAREELGPNDVSRIG